MTKPSDYQNHLEQLYRLSSEKNWDECCQWAENNIPEIRDHLETWGSNCGAPYDVYRGHVVMMVLKIRSEYMIPF